MYKKLLCMLCVGILLTGCGQPTKNDQKEANAEEKSEVTLSSEETLVKSLKEASYVVEDGKEADEDVKDYVSMKTSKKDNITLDVFVFKDAIAAKTEFKTKLGEKDKADAVTTIDATKNNEAIGYVLKENLVVRVRIPEGSVNDVGAVFKDFHLPR